MNWSIDFAPLLPAPLLWAAGLIAAVLVGVLVYRRSRGAALRALALTALIAALTNPVLRQEERESLANVAVVVMDESTSQALSKRPEQSAAIKTELEKRWRGSKISKSNGRRRARRANTRHMARPCSKSSIRH